MSSSSGESSAEPAGSLFDPPPSVVVKRREDCSDSEGSGAKKKKKKRHAADSGTNKKRRRHSLGSIGSERRKALSASHSSDEHEALNQKARTCSICQCRSTDADPISAGPGQGKEKPQRMRWERKGACCYYCARVHERRYGHLSRKALKEELSKEPVADDESTPKEKFFAARDKCIAFLEVKGRVPTEFAHMCIEKPAKTVTATSGKYERSSRRGKMYRLDVFTRLFPDADPKKKGIVFERKDAKGNTTRWLKVFNDEEGVEEFSEGEGNRVEEETVVDNGMLIFDDAQQKDAFDHAVSASLASLGHGGFTVAELGPSASSSAAQAKPKAVADKRSRKSDADGSDEETTDEDEDIVPLDRAMGKKQTPKKAAAQKQEKATPLKSVQAAEQAALSIVESAKESMAKFTACQEGAAEDMEARFKKLAAEAKKFETKILVRAGKLDLARSAKEAEDKILMMTSFLRAYTAWKKARIEGRSFAASKRRKLSAKDPVGLLTAAVSQLKDASIKMPVWARACGYTVRVDDLLAESKHLAAAEMITTALVRDSLQVTDASTVAYWTEQWASDILLNTLKEEVVDRAKADLKAVLKALCVPDLYAFTDSLQTKTDLLGILVEPASYDQIKVRDAVASMRMLQSGNSVFWMLAPAQTAMLQMLDAVKAQEGTRDKEESLSKTLGDIFTKVHQLHAHMSEGSEPDFAQCLDILTDSARNVVGVLGASSMDALRQDFLATASKKLVAIMQSLAKALSSIDQHYLIQKWGELVFDSSAWKKPEGIDIIESLASRHALMRDELQRLDDVEFGTVQKQHFLRQELFKEPHMKGWVCDLEFRISHLYLMARFCGLPVELPPADAEGAKSPELAADFVAQIVEVCSAKVKFDALLLSVGAPICQPEGKSASQCLTDIVEPVVKQLGERVVNEKMGPFKKSLACASYPAADRSKLLPPAATDDDLSVIAAATTTLAHPLGHVLASLGKHDELCILEAQAKCSILRASAARVLLETRKLPPQSGIDVTCMTLPPTFFVALKSMSNAMALATESLKVKPQSQTEDWDLCKAIVDIATQFWAERLVETESRISSMMRCGVKCLTASTPEWRSFTLGSPDVEEIKAKLINVDLGAEISRMYPSCTALHNDVQTFDNDLGMNLRLKFEEDYAALGKAICEAKLCLAVQHAVHIIYVTGPLARGPKAKAGLVREFKRRVKAANVNIPSELMVQVNAV